LRHGGKLQQISVRMAGLQTDISPVSHSTVMEGMLIISKFIHPSRFWLLHKLL